MSRHRRQQLKRASRHVDANSQMRLRFEFAELRRIALLRAMQRTLDYERAALEEYDHQVAKRGHW